MNCQSLGFGINCIDANYLREGLACFYLMQHRGECAIIETGTSHSMLELQTFMRQQGIEPEQVRYIIPTHVHLDHAGGAGTMMAAFANAQLLIHPRGARHMVDPARLIASSIQVYGEQRFQTLYGEIKPVQASRVREMADGDAVELAGRRLEFRHTAGHANHHFCIWDELSRGWFSGDMFGISYRWFRYARGDYLMPATTPTQFDPEAFQHSLELLHSYHPERMFLTHYGELRYSESKKRALAAQVAAYAPIAMDCGGEFESLKQSLIDYSLQQLRQFAPVDTPQDRLLQQISMDADLNAQGLAVWHQRTQGVAH